MHHDHDHEHGTSGELSFEEKMVKLLEHWIQHNTDHAETYRDWAEKADENYLKEIGGVLAEVAEMTLGINKKLKDGLEFLK